MGDLALLRPVECRSLPPQVSWPSRLPPRASELGRSRVCRHGSGQEVAQSRLEMRAHPQALGRPPSSRPLRPATAAAGLSAVGRARGTHRRGPPAGRLTVCRADLAPAGREQPEANGLASWLATIAATPAVGARSNVQASACCRPRQQPRAPSARRRHRLATWPLAALAGCKPPASAQAQPHRPRLAAGRSRAKTRSQPRGPGLGHPAPAAASRRL